MTYNVWSCAHGGYIAHDEDLESLRAWLRRAPHPTHARYIDDEHGKPLFVSPPRDEDEAAVVLKWAYASGTPVA